MRLGRRSKTGVLKQSRSCVDRHGCCQSLNFPRCRAVDRSRPRRAAKRALDNGKPRGLEPRRTKFCCTKFCRAKFCRTKFCRSKFCCTGCRCAKLSCGKFPGVKSGCCKSRVSESDCAKFNCAKFDLTQRDRTGRDASARPAGCLASADRRRYLPRGRAGRRRERDPGRVLRARDLAGKPLQRTRGE